MTSRASGPEDRAAAATLVQLLSGAWVARIIHATAELGLADNFGDDAQDCASLAKATGTHAPSLARLLRALAAIGIARETDDRRYALTRVGAMLRSDTPGSMRGWARLILSELDERPWRDLARAVRTGECAFEHAFGSDAWSYRAAHPDSSKLFDEAMQSLTQSANAAVGTHYPFGDFRWIVDIGGGNGALLLAVLERHPDMRGTVYELPHVAALARQRIAAEGFAARCEAMDGDALSAVPPGADAYLLKGVIHGRGDDEAINIYRNCRAAMPAHGKLLLMERLLPERVDPDDARGRTNLLVDINMMLMSPGGRERTEAEHRNLLRRAGLQVARVIDTPSPISIVEAMASADGSQ